MISLTESAAETVKKIIQEQGIDPSGAFLRCGCKGGGCSGLEYTLDVTTQKTEEDEEFESAGMKIVCDLKSLMFLDGTEIDYKSSMMESGFVFNNPNATHCCGCNKSFSV